MPAIDARWVLAAGLVALGLAAPARAQDDAPLATLEPDEQGLAMRVEPLGDGVVRGDRWSAMRVTVVNLGPATTATLAIEGGAVGGESVGYERPIELPQGARKDVTVPYVPGTGFGPRRVVLGADDGRMKAAEVALRTLAPDDVAVAVIGDDPLGVQVVTDTWAGPVPGPAARPLASGPRAVRVGAVPLATMPDRSALWGAFDTVVWPRPDPSEIDRARLDALLGWVADGGHLVVVVADGVALVRGTPLEDALPVALRDVGALDDPAPLYAAIGNPAVAAAPAPAPRATATPRDDPDRPAWTFAATADGAPLWTIGAYGLGTVTALTVDPTLRPLAGVVDREALWRRLLWLPPADTTDASWYPGGDDTPLIIESHSGASGLPAPDTWPEHGGPLPRELAAALHLGTSSVLQPLETNPGTDEWTTAWTWREALRERLGDIEGTSPLPMSWLLGFTAVYLLVIGPIDGFVLRALGREPLTWLTFPVYVAVFTAGALGITTWYKGDQAAIVRIELVDALPGTDRWRGDAYVGVFATRKAELTYRSGFDNAIAAPNQPRGAMWDVAVSTTEGPGRVRWRAETWTLAYVRSAWVAPAPGTLTMTPEPDARAVRITSTLPFDLSHVDAVVDGTVYEIGPVAAGESRVLPLTTSSPFVNDPHGEGPDLRRATVAELRDWARSKLVVRPPDRRGSYDATWAHPSLVAITDAPVEPLELSGLSPSRRQVTVLRVPLSAAMVAALRASPAAAPLVAPTPTFDTGG